MTLEQQIEELRVKLEEVGRRVRLSVVAEAFLAGEHGAKAVCAGDHCLIDGELVRVSWISSNGKWTLSSGNRCWEPFRTPPSDDIQRLYTPAEVAEIVAKIKSQVDDRR